MAAPSYNLSMWVSNGSVYDNYVLNTFPEPSHDIGSNITLFPNGTASIQFKDASSNLFLGLPLIDALLDGDKKLFPINCAYPLSGQYDHLPRALFYGLIAFAVLFSGKLAGAAMGVIMIYSSTACVHLFVLLGYYGFGLPLDSDGYPKVNSDTTVAYGDIDFWGIAPVIAISAISLTPIMHWVRSHEWRRGKVLLICWSLLIFAAMFPVCIFSLEWEDKWSVDRIPSVAVCEKTCVGVSTPLTSNLSFPEIVTLEDYQSKACNCFDYCGSLSPTAPLRTRQNMAPLLIYKAARDILCKDKACNTGRTGVLALQQVIVYLWVVTLAQGILALLCVNTTPSGMRNGIFSTLSHFRFTVIRALFMGHRRETLLRRFRVTDPARLNSNTLYRRVRRIFALTVSLFLYLHALSVPLLSFCFFILSIGLAELLLGTISGAERSDAIGSWGPVTALGFTVFAALVQQFERPLRNRFRRFKYSLQYSSGDRPTSEDTNKQPSRRRLGSKDIMPHISNRVQYITWKGYIRYRELREWIKDPVYVSACEREGHVMVDHTRYDQLPNDHAMVDLSRSGRPLNTSDKDVYIFHGFPVHITWQKPQCRCRVCSARRRDEDSEPEQLQSMHAVNLDSPLPAKKPLMHDREHQTWYPE